MGGPLPNLPACIRAFRPGDAAACRQLYKDGLIGGRLADNDTGFDIENIQAAYMRQSCNHFWVAEVEGGAIVGMIGVQQHDDGVGEIRRLRVANSHARLGIDAALVETALRFCEEKQYLKIKLDTFMDPQAAVNLFAKFRFFHDHTRTLGDRHLMCFYLDLYRGAERPPV